MVNLDLGYTRMIIAECEAQGLFRNQAAYVLATAFWETARTMKPVREMGGEKYLKSKDYYPYVGMGFVQLTWKNNYIRAGKELGVDFLSDPKKLLEPRHATPILVTGMREGWFDVITHIASANSKAEPMLQLLDVSLGALTSVRNGGDQNGRLSAIKTDLARYALAKCGVGIGHNHEAKHRRFSLWTVTPKYKKDAVPTR